MAIDKAVFANFVSGLFINVDEADIPNEGMTEMENAELTTIGSIKRFSGCTKEDTTALANKVTHMFQKDSDEYIVTDGTTFWTVTK